MRTAARSLLLLCALSLGVNGALGAGHCAVATVQSNSAIPASRLASEKCVERAEALIKKVQIKNALAELDSAIEVDPCNPKLYLYRATVRASWSDYSGAFSDYDTVLQLDPKSIIGHLGRANLSNSLGNYSSAIADDNMAIRLDSMDALSFNNRGIDRYDSGDFRGAVDDFSHALKLGSLEDYWSYWWRGNAHEKLGDRFAALDDLTEAIKRNSKYALPYGDRARIRCALGDKDGALDDLNRALRLSDRYPYLFRQRADLLSSMGEPKLAVQDYSVLYALSKDTAALFRSAAQRLLVGDCGGAAADVCRAFRENARVFVCWFGTLAGNLQRFDLKHANDCISMGFYIVSGGFEVRMEALGRRYGKGILWRRCLGLDFVLRNIDPRKELQ